MSDDITLAVRSPQLPPTREEADARRAMIQRFGDSSRLPEIPYESPKPESPALSTEIAERRKLRDEVAATEARIKELQRQLEVR